MNQCLLGTEGPTIAKDEELVTVTSSDLAEQRQQVEWDTLGILAHETRGVSTAGVEVAQQSAVPLLKGLASLGEVVTLGVDVVGDEVLNGGLGAAVGVGRANGAVLGDGNHVLEASGVAVDGGRGGENNVGNVVLLHGAEEGDAAADVDAVVLEGDLGGFTDGLNC